MKIGGIQPNLGSFTANNGGAMQVVFRNLDKRSAYANS